MWLFDFAPIPVVAHTLHSPSILPLSFQCSNETFTNVKCLFHASFFPGFIQNKYYDIINGHHIRFIATKTENETQKIRWKFGNIYKKIRRVKVSKGALVDAYVDFSGWNKKESENGILLFSRHHPLLHEKSICLIFSRSWADFFN